MKIGTIDVDKLRGVGDKIIGLAVETTGVIISNEKLQERGEAQQTKGSESLKALKSEAEAETQRKKAQSLSNGTGTDLGALDEVKGKFKKSVGRVTDNADMQREGQTEQRKGAAQRKAAQSEAEAKAHEVKAEAADAKQSATSD